MLVAVAFAHLWFDLGDGVIASHLGGPTSGERDLMVINKRATIQDRRFPPQLDPARAHMQHHHISRRVGHRLDLHLVGRK